MTIKYLTKVYTELKNSGKFTFFSLNMYLSSGSFRPTVKILNKSKFGFSKTMLESDNFPQNDVRDL